MQKTYSVFKIKSVDPSDGSFVGLGAVYNNVDLGGDQIMPGAFTKTLQPAGRPITILWQHNSDQPIGQAKITDSPAGLRVEGQLVLGDPIAERAYYLMKTGTVKGLSIGYETLQSKEDGDVRQLTELKLWEISVVTFPMNPDAQISSVKAVTEEDRQKHLKGANEDRKGIDRLQRSLRIHLKALGLDDDDPADNPDLIGADDIDDDPDDSEMSAIISGMKSLTALARQLGERQ